MEGFANMLAVPTDTPSLIICSLKLLVLSLTA
jgi:hypothetical protein